MLAQYFERPDKIDNRKPAVLPVGHSVFGAKTIEIDGDVNIRTSQPSSEFLEMCPPVFAQDRAAPLSIFRRMIVRPGMNFEFAGAFGAAISKNLMWPPTFKISTAPNADLPHMRKLQRAVHPTATRPFRRPNVPVGMIIERHQNKRLRDAARPKGGKMMEIARAIK